MRKRHLWLLGAILASAGAVPGGEPLEDAWISLEGYRFQKALDQPLKEGESVAWEGIEAAVVEEYSPRRISGWRLRTPQGVSLRLTALEMLDSPGATGLLGLWSIDRPDSVRLPGLERAHRRVGETLHFVVGPYLFSLTGSRFLEETARAIAQSVDQPDLDAVTVLNLPQEGLLADLSSHYLGARSAARDPDVPRWLIPLAGFHDGVELSVARYETDRRLLLLGYPTPDLARAALRRIERQLPPSGLKAKRSVVLVALSAADELLDRVVYQARIKWVHEKEPFDPRLEVTTLYAIFQGWILFTVAFIVVVVGTGGVIALVRFGIHRRFPVWASRDAMIRLGIDDL